MMSPSLSTATSTRSSSVEGSGQQSRSDPQPFNGVGPCPIALKSILRRRLCYNRASASTDSVNSICSHRSVKFDEHVDEHLADEWDRSSCPVASPTSRDIWELKQMQRELLPSGQGVIKDDRCPRAQTAEDEYYFDLFGDDDVDCSQRTPPRRAPAKKLLNKVPIGLCPILPVAAPILTSSPVTPNNSMAPSPLNSPPHGSPILAAVKDDVLDAKNKRGAPLMKFMPLLPAEQPTSANKTKDTSSSAINGGNNIPTPPDTPTYGTNELPTVHDVRPKQASFLPCGPATIPSSSPERGRKAVTSLEPKQSIPTIQLASLSPIIATSPPPSSGRLTFLPVLPQRVMTPPHPPPSTSTSMGGSIPTWPSPSGSRMPTLPASMKTGGGRCSPSLSSTTTTTTTMAPGFLPVTFKATGRT